MIVMVIVNAVDNLHYRWILNNIKLELFKGALKNINIQEKYKIFLYYRCMECMCSRIVANNICSKFLTNVEKDDAQKNKTWKYVYGKVVITLTKDRRNSKRKMESMCGYLWNKFLKKYPKK